MDAGNLLRGALLIGRSNPSSAFIKLLTLLPFPKLLDPLGADVPPPDLGAIPFVKPLAASLSLADEFLKDKMVIWGRDYITISLLASGDASLVGIAEEADSDLQRIRDEWLEFVRSSEKRRSREAWEQWWRRAGVPLPGETVPPETSAAPVPSTSYLLTWNPTRFPFPTLEEHLEQIRSQGFSHFRWSTGNRRNMETGARVLLLRQGPEPRGLVGVGAVEGRVEEGPHWDEAEAAKGRKSLLVQVRWQALSREPFLGLGTLIDTTGVEEPWSSQASGVEIPPEVAASVEESWPLAWAAHGNPSQDAVPELEARRWIARFTSDRGDQQDSLHIDRYVDAFARVLASRALTPPLSIGLFGDWGSGKTFFMDRLHAKVEELCNEEPERDGPLYWPRICQIRFNAWHYAETNLWASLVSTIFNRLRLHLDGADPESDEFNRLLNRLELAGELRKEAEERLQRAVERREEAHRRVEEAEKALEELPKPPDPSDEELREILAASVSEVSPAEPEAIARLLESAAEWSGRDELKRAAERLRTGETTVEEARAVLAEVRSLSSRAGFWWRVLSAAKLHRTVGFWVVLVLLAAIPVLISLAQRRFDWPEGWAHFWAALAEITTAGTAMLAWLRSHLGGASAVFDRLDGLQASIERRVEEAKTTDRRAYERKRDEAAGQEKATLQELEEARRQQVAAAEEERKAREALGESTSLARLGRFIRERASSADYAQHLGLIAMIHRDFERLSGLMEGARWDDTDSDLPRIDRIILYIDDLDRCHPPEKVVRVLEAVHLLLFFPLFVVVVGVDSRWISRALCRHYDGMLADEALVDADPSDALQRAPADSQDFLEKIFQVPFWLRRMEPAAVQRLIHSLITPDEIERSAPPPPTPTAPPRPQSAPDPKDEGTRELTPLSNDPAAPARRLTAEAEGEHESLGEPLAPPTERLGITEAELQFMDEVAPLMPRTPRSVKRFVNIYRLYKAALSTPALGRFLGTGAQPGNYRAVQVLLALVTGAPRFAQRVFQELHASGTEGKRLSNLMETLSDGEEESWQTTLDALRRFAEGDNDLELEALREVSPLVSRYSVHHMVSQTPGESGLG